MALAYSFRDKLKMSQGIAQQASVADILLANIPGAARIEQASKADDRNGVDYWVYRAADRPLSVDVKVREADYKPRGRDDLALETWSVVERRRIGWTLDEKKQTDYILWFWKDTGRWCMVPFVMLNAVFRDKWQEWYDLYQHNEQKTVDGGYHSECVFVPRVVVWRAIYSRFSG